LFCLRGKNCDESPVTRGAPADIKTASATGAFQVLIEMLSCKRHCERSEAIRFFLRDFLDCFGAKRLAMTANLVQFKYEWLWMP
jgi:hypothetical protein